MGPKLTKQELVVPSGWLPPESRAEISLCLRGTAIVPLHGKNGIPIRQTFTMTGDMSYHRGRIGKTESKTWDVGGVHYVSWEECLVCSQSWEAMSVVNPE